MTNIEMFLLITQSKYIGRGRFSEETCDISRNVKLKISYKLGRKCDVRNLIPKKMLVQERFRKN